MPKRHYGHCFHGVNYASPPYELLRTELADASNIVPTEHGLPTKRGGTVKLNNTSLASRVTSFFEHRTGSTRNQLCSYSTKIAEYDNSSREFTDVITGLTSNCMTQWVNFAGKAICVNGGNDAPQYYTDSSTNGALAGTPPTGKTIAEWANRLWFGGDTTNLATITGSCVNDPTDWTTTGDAGYVAQIVGDSKDPITGIFPFFDVLLIGKSNNIYRCFSTADTPTVASTLSIRPLYSKQNENAGFTSPWAITQVGNDVIFLDGYDIKSLRATESFGDVEYSSIIPHFRNYLKDTVDKDYLQYAQFFHYKKEQQVWVSIPTGSATHFVFVLDYKFLKDTGRYSFYPMADLTVSCFGGVEDGNVTNIHYGDETGYVYQMDCAGNNDSGSAITAYFTTLIHGNSLNEGILEKHEIRKQFQYSDSYIEPVNDTLTMTPYYAIDLMNSEQIRTAENYTAMDAETVSSWSGTGVKNKRNRFWGLSGKTLALKWYHSTLAENFIFYPSIIDYQWKSKTTIS